MLMVISPAKKLDVNSPLPAMSYTQPRFIPEAARVMEVLKGKTVDEIAALMKLSPALAQLNHERYQDWAPQFDLEHARPALLTFNGDVYAGIDARTLSPQALDFAQQHLRILSGLYGVLRPLDLIRPYRLEMGTRLPVGDTKNLYSYWKNTLAQSLREELPPGEPLINLASEEYFSAIDLAQLDRPVVHCVFQEKRGNGFKIIGCYAKRARGLMCRYIVDNAITRPEDLRDFKSEGYAFDAASSSPHLYYFRRSSTPQS